MIDEEGSRLDQIRRERAIFARHGRSHPHFKRNITIDALLSMSLVLGLFGAVNQLSAHQRRAVLMKSGAISMTSDELVRHVKQENLQAYWFGPITGYKYTIICTNRREIIVSYLPQGVSLNHPDRFNLTVETYSSTLLNEEPAKSKLSTDRDDFVNSDGSVNVDFSPSGQRVRFMIPNTNKVVEVQYPSAKQIGAVYMDAEKLRLISELQP